jgi:hypothetical protein
MNNPNNNKNKLKTFYETWKHISSHSFTTSTKLYSEIFPLENFWTFQSMPKITYVRVYDF